MLEIRCPHRAERQVPRTRELTRRSWREPRKGERRRDTAGRGGTKRAAAANCRAAQGHARVPFGRKGRSLRAAPALRERQRGREFEQASLAARARLAPAAPCREGQGTRLEPRAGRADAAAGVDDHGVREALRHRASTIVAPPCPPATGRSHSSQRSPAGFRLPTGRRRTAAAAIRSAISSASQPGHRRPRQPPPLAAGARQIQEYDVCRGSARRKRSGKSYQWRCSRPQPRNRSQCTATPLPARDRAA
jgi:hypothetical protein